MVKGKQVGFKPSGRVVIISKNDKRVNCSHEDKILYCVRDGCQYYWCNSCHNLLREEIEKPKMNVLDKIKNKLKR
jgi:hypothetical protein